ncbi:MAG: VWA domain-containing protein [Actinomycetota bacterium]|nr:VWA domain-containing protein [Actinomycetota bacterium]
MATRLEASGPKFGWHTLAEASRKKGDDMRLALPDPARSAAGVVTLEALVDEARRRGVRTEEAVISLRRPVVVSDDVAVELPELAQGRVGAVTVTERDLLTYNAANDVADALVGAPVGPSNLTLDYRLVSVSDPLESLTRDETEAIEALAEVLSSDEARAVLADAKLRTVTGALLDESAVEGASWPVSGPAQIDPAATTDLLSKWATVGRRGRVLAVIDVSGSMAPRVGRGPTRLELAVSAASRALGTFAPDSDIGLWAFSTNLGKGKDHRELLSTAPLASERSGTTQRKAALQALVRLAPKRGGGTGLYDTVLAAFREAQRSYSAGRLNAVVLLTDGRNDDDKSVGRAGMLRALKKESDPERPVRVITLAYGENADVKLLRAVSDATGARSYVVKDPKDVDRVVLEALTSL